MASAQVEGGENEELRRQNKTLATQFENQKQSRKNWLNRIVQLESQQAEDDTVLCAINTYWKLFDESCKILSKQVDCGDDRDLSSSEHKNHEHVSSDFDDMLEDFDDPALDNKEEGTFLTQVSTLDLKELKDKLEHQVQQSEQCVQKIVNVLQQTFINANKLYDAFIIKNIPLKLKTKEAHNLRKFVKTSKKLMTLQREYYSLNLKVKSKQDLLHINETRNDEIRNRASNIRYQNVKMKAATDKLEHDLAELLDNVKVSQCFQKLEALATEKICENEKDSPNNIGTNYLEDNKRMEDLEREIKENKINAEKYLEEMQIISAKDRVLLEHIERLKIEVNQLPENIITQSKKYKHLQSRYSILYNESTQLRLSGEVVEKQMHSLKNFFNKAQINAERECLLQQRNIRLEMIKLDDVIGQLRYESHKLKLYLEQSIAEHNLYESLNAELRKLLNSMLDHCKQHESDIYRYKRKYEEMEDDVRFSRTKPISMCSPPVTPSHQKPIDSTLKNESLEKQEKSNGRTLSIPSTSQKTDVIEKDIPRNSTNTSTTPLLISKPGDLINPVSNFSGNAPLRTKSNQQQQQSQDDQPSFEDLMSAQELSHCKDLVHGFVSAGVGNNSTKLIYSREVLKSKEMLKERYLRDCSKMAAEVSSNPDSMCSPVPLHTPLLPPHPPQHVSETNNTRTKKPVTPAALHADNPLVSNLTEQTKIVEKISSVTQQETSKSRNHRNSSIVNLDSDESIHEDEPMHLASNTPSPLPIFNDSPLIVRKNENSKICTNKPDAVKDPKDDNIFVSTNPAAKNISLSATTSDNSDKSVYATDGNHTAVKYNDSRDIIVSNGLTESSENTAATMSTTEGRKASTSSPPTKRDLYITKLKSKLKKSMDEKKDLNLVLGMYKNVNKTEEEKVHLLVSEQKLKVELEKVKSEMKKVDMTKDGSAEEAEMLSNLDKTEGRSNDTNELVEECVTQKIKYLSAKRRRLQKKVDESKESMLCREMEITGQVWDELQTQNTRLQQMLREKEEENLKLMTERVKSNQLYNISKEENEEMKKEIKINKEKTEAKTEIIRKLEDREIAIRNRLIFLERELTMRKKMCDSNKRKALENVQNTYNLKKHTEKLKNLIIDLVKIKAEKSDALEDQQQKNNVISEEVNQLRRKFERMKKYESVDTIEAILTEESKEYKNMLTCPSCKVNKKDAVLIKCFHVYCMTCIKTRYETRQRKCPECCAAFGANDYHKLFLFN